MDSIDYREFFSNFVDEEYVNMVDEEAFDYVEEYSDLGGSPGVCVAVGLTETENLGMSLEEIAEEVEVSRKAVYNARKDLDLEIMESRGRNI